MVCQCTRLFHIERLQAVWWTARHVQFSSRVHVDSAARRFGFGGFSLLNCCSVCVLGLWCSCRIGSKCHDWFQSTTPQWSSQHRHLPCLPPARVQHVVAPRSVRRSPCLSSAAEHWRPELVMMTALFVGIAEKRRFRLPAVALSAKKEGKETKKAKDAVSNKIRTFFGRVYALFSLPFGGAGNFAQVDQGSVGVVLRFGKFDRMLDPGRHQFNVAVEKVMIVPLTLDKSWQALNFHSRILRSKFGKSIKSQSTLVRSWKLRSSGRLHVLMCNRRQTRGRNGSWRTETNPENLEFVPYVQVCSMALPNTKDLWKDKQHFERCFPWNWTWHILLRPIFW